MIGRLICKVRRHHHWLMEDYGATPMPGVTFIPREDICLTCGDRRVTLPNGSCLQGGNHPLAEHYDAEGQLVSHPTCPGPA